MAELIADCPRCSTVRVTFDVKAVVYLGQEYGWMRWFEAFAVCRNCRHGTIFVIHDDVNADSAARDKDPMDIKVSLNNFLEIDRFISLKDAEGEKPPEHLPPDIEAVFKEAATCVVVQCWNAAGAMFRACIDLATRPMLPEGEVEGLSNKTRRDLGLRLPWLFEHGYLAKGLQPLSACIHQDGNDAAHAVNLKREDAEDLLDFTKALLERIYTEPERIKIAEARREARRGKKD